MNATLSHLLNADDKRMNLIVKWDHPDGSAHLDELCPLNIPRVLQVLQAFWHVRSCVRELMSFQRHYGVIAFNTHSQLSYIPNKQGSFVKAFPCITTTLYIIIIMLCYVIYKGNLKQRRGWRFFFHDAFWRFFLKKLMDKWKGVDGISVSQDTIKQLILKVWSSGGSIIWFNCILNLFLTFQLISPLHFGFMN